MVKHHNDQALMNRLKQLIDDEVRVSTPERGIIGNRVKIINTKDITNTVIKGDCEIRELHDFRSAPSLARRMPLCTSARVLSAKIASSAMVVRLTTA